MFTYQLSFFFIGLIFNSCNKSNFSISPSSDELFHMKNGDYLIPVRIRGNTASKKIILFVQGGPGSNTLDFAEIDYPGWKSTLEKKYAVAYYDQRGTRNQQGSLNLEEFSISLYVDDLHEIAAFLQTAHEAEIIMLGHSFGGHLSYS